MFGFRCRFSHTKKGFTLAEVLITLAIIGVVAAITIPSVIVNTNQMEFKTGLRKAVSVLNQSITLSKALTGESPYDNSDLYNYLQQNMSVMQSKVTVSGPYANNYAFYTTDGMRYEIYTGDNGGAAYSGVSPYSFRLYESGVTANICTCSDYHTCSQECGGSTGNSGTCGSMGLAHNPDGTTNPPCVIVVDVNGNRKPLSLSERSSESSSGGIAYGVDSMPDYPKPTDRLLKDYFPILITDQGAIPYGVVAQKAMYQAQK